MENDDERFRAIEKEWVSIIRYNKNDAVNDLMENTRKS